MLSRDLIDVKTGRNEPCPCGSGRKYKHCCIANETRATGNGRRLQLSGEMRAKAREYPEWEADVVPLPATVEGSDRTYAAATLVCAGPVVVAIEHTELGGAEPDHIAELIERAVSTAAESVGSWPEEVVVRHPEVAAALDERFEHGMGPLGRGDGPEVSSIFYLDNLDAPARDLVARLAGEATWPPVAIALTWAAWGLSEPDVASLFSAAANYYRAAPWELLDDAPPLTAVWPDGDEWTLAVLGAAGVSRGLAVYADYEDYEASLRASSPEDVLDDPGNWVVGLYFVDHGEVPRPMQREVARAGWEVAAPEAYPLVAPLLTPGGGLPSRLARRFTEVLDGVTALVEANADRLKRGDSAECEPSDGPWIYHPGEDAETADPYGTVPAELHDLFDDLRAGKFGSEEEAQREFDARVSAFNAAPRAELSGLSPNQAQALLEGDWDGTGPLRLADDLSLGDLDRADFLHNARALLAAADAGDGAPATAAGNLKRAFVADMIERMRWREGELDRIRHVNKVINEGDVPGLHRLRVVLEVAELLQREKGRFRVTKHGRELLDDDDAGRLMAHLFRTYFRDYNIGYGGRGPETESLQYVVPLILARLPREADAWIERDELAGKLLPPEPSGSPRTPEASAFVESLDLRRIQLSVHVLDPLVRFGLLEERRTGGRWPFGTVDVRVTEVFERFVRVESG